MNFNGRWVPLEVMDTIVALWVIVAIALSALLFRLRRAGRQKKTGQSRPRKNGSKLEPKHGHKRRNSREKS